MLLLMIIAVDAFRHYYAMPLPLIFSLHYFRRCCFCYAFADYADTFHAACAPHAAFRDADAITLMIRC